MIFLLPGIISIMILVLFISAATVINSYKAYKLSQYGEGLLEYYYSEDPAE